MREDGQNRSEILYIYDRVCTREAKHREVLRKYGMLDPSTDNPSREKVYESPYARSAKRSGTGSAPLRRNRSGPKRDSGSARRERTGTYASSSSRETGAGRAYQYQYRPMTPDGGEAARDSRFRAGIDWFLNFFESPESRAEGEMRSAKRRAAAAKRWKEYRHIILTALILLILAVVIGAVCYRVFFVVQDVDVSGSENYGDAEVVDAAGISLGDKLYSFRASDAEGEITFLCPYIKSADVRRHAPTSVTITLEDDAPAYVANIWGDTVLLSAGLRVLELNPAEVPDGLITLILPPVDKSVAGRVLVFTGSRAERYIRRVLADAMASNLAADGMIDRIDLTDEYEITMEACGLYSLTCGGESDMGLKLKMAYAAITSGQLEEDVRASINLKEVGEATVINDYREGGK
ncbi:MAG: FtsQ-type POTRA domain-containing protein [Clostridia bacterium]|nr:FtsQ-type POTRA domain-containing protein [Clostridia bacterium]